LVVVVVVVVLHDPTPSQYDVELVAGRLVVAV